MSIIVRKNNVSIERVKAKFFTVMGARLMVELSVVVPVYRSAGSLVELHRRLQETLRTITSNYELVFVEDCGGDESWEILEKIALKDRKVLAFRLSRNFGQHAAITAGLSQCAGNWAVVMDCDLQDPPEEIPRFYAKALSGYDIVFAKRKRKKEFFLRRFLSFFYFKLINFFNRSDIDPDFGTFSIISRKAIDAFLKVQDRDRHYLFILYWLGFGTATVEYEHEKRHSGKSSYGFKSLMVHALNGLFFQTTILLQWIVYLGFGVSSIGVLFAGWTVYEYFFHSVTPGWTSLIFVILMVSGFIIISTGIAGLYIGKIFEQVKGRPLYVLDRKIAHGVKDFGHFKRTKGTRK